MTRHLLRTRLIRQFLLFLLTCAAFPAHAQRFFNLTSDQVSVDSVMPSFAYTMPLPPSYGDSIYTATILYPEFIDMTPLDLERYLRLGGTEPLALPTLTQRVVTDRKQPMLRMSFCPVVKRDGKYQFLVSFMLRVDSKGANAKARAKANTRSASRAPQTGRYADHSVLASGKWAKIRVSASGVYELTKSLVNRAGFSDLSRVRVYGYGGNLQDEVLDGTKLADTDDLHEVATCTVNGKRLFYAKGPVSWSGNDTETRTRNPYSDYGYYFITEGDATPASVDSATFISSFYPSPDFYHSLHEEDGYSWYPGGRNLFDPTSVTAGNSQVVTLTHPDGATSGRFSVRVSAGVNTTTQVSVNGKAVGTLSISIGSQYDHGNVASGTYAVPVSVSRTDTVTLTVLSGGPMRLDYVSAAWDNPTAAPDLNGSFPTPVYVGTVSNQDLHADKEIDMVIIIPTSRKLLTQATRLAQFHESHDALRVKIVAADELFNEFSSGTPDANAYRRYVKMLYDRAQSNNDAPKYLLLFGPCVWDNRMLTNECKSLNPDDFLLAYESENSFNAINCYVDDGFFTYLDDGEGNNLTSPIEKLDMGDVAVGRLPAYSEEMAKIMVDKTINYVENHNAGDWENTIMVMGDDGNNNIHMRDADETATLLQTMHPAYNVRKVMWDAYNEVTSSTGNTYPEVTDIIKRQQAKGALIMDYYGHGRADQMSHENVLTLADFEAFNNKNLPLWVFAACDIMAFDGVEDNIGVTAMTNSNGGAVAVFGTTRTVYENYNHILNKAFMKYVLSSDNGKPTTIGEAQRLAKNEVIRLGSDPTVNKLQYTLLGDPAIALNQPTGTVVIDSINGKKIGDGSTVNAYAGQTARVAGHVVGDASMKGTVSLQVLDSKQLITCHENASAEVKDTVFTFYDRQKTVFNGTDSVTNGKFHVSFVVPYDISYGGSGQLHAFAMADDYATTAHGYTDAIVLDDSNTQKTDTIGPKIFCYLNSPEFVNGDEVNTSPYFVARLSDDSGINATGNGVGHNLELVIDGDANMTYDLNDNFAYDFGSHVSGSTYYSIPTLEPGSHSLLFRAWDTMNNSSEAQLRFNVVKSLKPRIYSVDVTKNPASSSTTFIVSHSLEGCPVDVTIDVFDMSGRQLWTCRESGTQAGSYSVDWNLTTSSGQRLQTGVYLYRIRLAADGSQMATKSKKLVVISNN